MTNSPNTQPIFIRTPRIDTLVLSSELGDRLPASSLVPKTLLIGADPATSIECIQIMPTGVMVASILYMYLYDITGTQGQSRLISQTVLPAISTTDPQQPIDVVLPKTLSPASPTPATPNQLLRIPLGWELRAALSTAIANPIIITAFGGDYY